MSTLSRLLKESWTLVEDQADELAQDFYARVFLADPSLRDLFPIHLVVQRTRLLDAIVRAIQTVEDPHALDEYLVRLGRDHRKFHATPEHYGVFGAALLDSLRTFAGDAWCIEYDQAWRDAYDAIATKMLTGAVRDPGPAFWSAEVVHHERRSWDLAVITCRPLTRFAYSPGQYVNVECYHHPRLWRPYSIANAPRHDGTLDLHVRAIPGGWVSTALVRRLRPRDMLRLGPPMGVMTLDHRSTRDIVCLAGGTGLAPIKALIEELGAVDRTRWVHLFLGARNRDEFYDLPALSRLAARYPWLSIVTACSDDPTYDGERGLLCDVVAQHGPWLDHDFYLAGPPAMMRPTLDAVVGLGVPLGRIHYDVQ